jgi:hypothetical protein
VAVLDECPEVSEASVNVRRDQVSQEGLGNRVTGYLGKPMELEISGENELRFLLEERRPAQFLFDA